MLPCTAAASAPAGAGGGSGAWRGAVARLARVLGGNGACMESEAGPDGRAVKYPE